MALPTASNADKPWPRCCVEFSSDLETTILTDAATSTASPTTPTERLLGEVHDYAELLDALRKRLSELGTSMERVDDVAGLPSRYTSKLFAPVQIKSLGRVSMGPLLGALGLKLLVIEDPAAFARVKHRLVRKKYAGGGMLAVEKNIWRRTPALARKIRHLQVLKQTPRRRREIACNAARRRWAKRAANGPAPANRGPR
jgi:hypothetical protein